MSPNKRVSAVNWQGYADFSLNLNQKSMRAYARRCLHHAFPFFSIETHGDFECSPVIKSLLVRFYNDEGSKYEISFAESVFCKKIERAHIMLVEELENIGSNIDRFLELARDANNEDVIRIRDHVSMNLGNINFEMLVMNELGLIFH